LKEGLHEPRLAIGPCKTPWLVGSFTGTIKLGGESVDAAGAGSYEDVFLIGLDDRSAE
jgi:hypothetical protein